MNTVSTQQDKISKFKFLMSNKTNKNMRKIKGKYKISVKKSIHFSMVVYHQPNPKGQIHYTVLKEKENKK